MTLDLNHFKRSLLSDPLSIHCICINVILKFLSFLAKKAHKIARDYHRLHKCGSSL